MRHQNDTRTQIRTYGTSGGYDRGGRGKEIEYKCRGCSDDDYERLIIIEISHFDWHDYEYRIKKVPTVKYIPFTVETFKEHRDRWVTHPCNIFAEKIVSYDIHGVTIAKEEHLKEYKYEQFLKNRFFDDTGEPCGQKIEE